MKKLGTITYAHDSVTVPQLFKSIVSKPIQDSQSIADANVNLLRRLTGFPLDKCRGLMSYKHSYKFNQNHDADGRFSTSSEDGGHYIDLHQGDKRVGRAFIKFNEREGHPILWTVDVPEAEQGKGYGSALLDKAIAFAKEKWPGNKLEIDAIEPKLQGALERRGATKPFPDVPAVRYVSLKAPVNVAKITAKLNLIQRRKLAKAMIDRIMKME